MEKDHDYSPSGVAVGPAPPEPAFIPPAPPAKPENSRRLLINWCCGGCLLMILLLAIALASALGPFVRWGAATDLSEYRAMISSSDAAESEKQLLLKRLDSLKIKIENGKAPGLFEWVHRHTTMESLIGDGHLSREDITAIHKEFNAMDTALKR